MFAGGFAHQLLRARGAEGLAALKAEGESILVIDKNVDALAKIADRHIVLEKGRVVWRGTSEELRSDSAVKDRFLNL